MVPMEAENASVENVSPKPSAWYSWNGFKSMQLVEVTLAAVIDDYKHPEVRSFVSWVNFLILLRWKLFVRIIVYRSS